MLTRISSRFQSLYSDNGKKSQVYGNSRNRESQWRLRPIGLCRICTSELASGSQVHAFGVMKLNGEPHSNKNVGNQVNVGIGNLSLFHFRQ